MIAAKSAVRIATLLFIRSAVRIARALYLCVLCGLNDDDDHSTAGGENSISLSLKKAREDVQGTRPAEHDRLPRFHGAVKFRGTLTSNFTF